MIRKLYPKAYQNRIHGSDPSVQQPRRGFLKMAAMNFLMLQALFLVLFAYAFGSLFQQNPRTHNMKILFVDYDHGAIGTSLRQAYASLKGDRFPTLIELPASDYATPKDLESAVCKTRYWAAIYVSPGASRRLENALAGGSAASTYNRSDVMTYIWNEARYPSSVDASISANIQTLVSNSHAVYIRNEMETFHTLSSADSAAVSVFANPWQITSANIQPTVQGSRMIYNTLVFILLLIQEFFYLGTVNGLYAQFKIYERLYPHRIIIFRNLISAAYTFIGSLCTTGAIWAFRAGWHVNASQFVLSWASLWLFAHVNFLTLDVFTIWLPAPYIPMALITWVVINVSSTLVPFELVPPFYRWAYAMPAHEVYQLLVDIWSRGCNPQLYYALPILFTLEVTGLLLSALGVYRRCHYAVLADEAQNAAFQSRLDAALDFERELDQQGLKAEAQAARLSSDWEGKEESIAMAADETQRSELAFKGAEIQRQQTWRSSRKSESEAEGSEIQRQQTKSSIVNFGPSFALGQQLKRSRTQPEAGEAEIQRQQRSRSSTLNFGPSFALGQRPRRVRTESEAGGTEPRTQQPSRSNTINFGPSFALPYGRQDDS